MGIGIETIKRRSPTPVLKMLDMKDCVKQEVGYCTNCGVYITRENFGKRLTDVLTSRKYEGDASDGKLDVTVLEALDIIFDLKKNCSLSRVIMDEEKSVICWKCSCAIMQLFRIFIEVTQCQHQKMFLKSVTVHNKALRKYQEKLSKLVPPEKLQLLVFQESKFDSRDPKDGYESDWDSRKLRNRTAPQRLPTGRGLRLRASKLRGSNINGRDSLLSPKPKPKQINIAKIPEMLERSKRQRLPTPNNFPRDWKKLSQELFDPKQPEPECSKPKNVKKYKCDQCPAEFAFSVVYEKHKRRIHKENNASFTCRGCSKTFKSAEDFQEHKASCAGSPVRETQKKRSRSGQRIPMTGGVKISEEKNTETINTTKMQKLHIRIFTRRQRGINRYRRKGPDHNNSSTAIRRTSRSPSKQAALTKIKKKRLPKRLKEDHKCPQCNIEMASHGHRHIAISHSSRKHIYNSESEMEENDSSGSEIFTQESPPEAPQKFVCKHCRQELASEKRLVRHCRIVHSENNFQCNYCQAGFTKKLNCMFHAVVCPSRRKAPIPCSTSSKRKRIRTAEKHINTTQSVADNSTVAWDPQAELPSENKLTSPLPPQGSPKIKAKQDLKINSVKNFTCTRCRAYFGSLNLYKSHNKICRKRLRKGKNFKCTECGAEIKSQTWLDSHMKRNHSVKNFTCYHCGAGFSKRARVFQQHFIRCNQLHKNGNRFRTGGSPKPNPTASAVDVDPSSSVSGSTTPTPVSSTTSFSSPVIEMVTSSTSTANIEAPVLPCSQCSEVYASQVLFKYHSRAHSTKKYACKSCLGGFASRYYVKHHNNKCRKNKQIQLSEGTSDQADLASGFLSNGPEPSKKKPKKNPLRTLNQKTIQKRPPKQDLVADE